MFKMLVSGVMFFLLVQANGQSDLSAIAHRSDLQYQAPSAVKLSWQRLNLLISSTYLHAAKEGYIDLDSCLIYASHSLGLSRLPVLAEGIIDPELIGNAAWVDNRDPGAGLRMLSQVRDTKRVAVLTLLGAYYAFQPKSYHYCRDSVEFYLTRAINESKNSTEKKISRQALCLLGKMYVQANDLKRGDSVFNLVIEESRLTGDIETEARAYSYRGLYTAFSHASTQDRIKYLRQSSVLYRKLNQPEGEINNLMNTGYLFVTLGQLKASYESINNALRMEDSINYPFVHYTADALSMVSIFDGKFGEPFGHSLRAIKVAEHTRDSIGWAYFYSRLALLYMLEGGKDEPGELWLRKSMNRFLIEKNPAVYGVLQNLVSMILWQGRVQEAIDLLTDMVKRVPPESSADWFSYHMAFAAGYIDNKKFKLAETHLLRADSMEKISETLRGPLRRSMIDELYGYLYLGQGQYQRARLYFEKYLWNNQPDTGTSVNDLKAYRQLITIDIKLRDTASRLRHLERYAELLDSNFKVSKIRQAEELQVLYQIEEKENEIDFLNQQRNLEKAHLKQATLAKNVTIGGIIVVLMIAGLLYRENRLKQKSNNLITHKNEQLQTLVDEKEWLFKEIHHRVKNNLHTVICLLESQAAYLENDALEAVEVSQQRIYAMSLIHQKIYQSEDIRTIDAAIYIPELIESLDDSFGSNLQIRYKLNIDPVQLDISQAVPVALIVNEAVTNSIKYAFPGNRPGIIEIVLTQEGDMIELIIADNGIGIASSLINTHSESLGLQLIKGLSKDIKGQVSIDNSHGTRIRIIFNLNSLNRNYFAAKTATEKEVYIVDE